MDRQESLWALIDEGMSISGYFDVSHAKSIDRIS
jgi:hypothetical protein